MGNGYGNIMDVKTTGASETTAKQDNLTYDGVRASETMAKTDAGRMEKYQSIIYDSGKRFGIEPALIAAIISRESRAGATLKNGRGDWDSSRRAYNAWGLMQYDINPKKNPGRRARGDWDSETHLNQCTKLLVDFIEHFQNDCPNWSKEKQLKAAIAAYNMGYEEMDYDDVDAHTTGGDYSNDVVARAQWYKQQETYCKIS